MATSPSKFSKVRRDHALETAQDYCEAIAAVCTKSGECRITDLARIMGVTHVTVTKIVRRLVADGLVEKVPYGPARLSVKGAALARHSSDRHVLVVSFLRALGVTPAEADRDAEGMEHHCGPSTLRAMREFISRCGPGSSAT